MSRFRDLRPHQPLPPKAQQKSPRKKATRPQPAPRPDPLGPRPVSTHQRELREHRVPRPPHPAALPPLAGRESSEGKRRKTVRDAETTRPRVKVSRAGRNRRRINIPQRLLGWALVALVVECAAALLFSPRLWVKKILVEGNQSVPARVIVSRLKLGQHDNILRLPVSRLRAAVGAEPRVETVAVYRDLRSMAVRVVVKERTPWACVQTADGTCYTIDSHLVPFRTADVPPVGMPLLKLSEATGSVPLGKPMSAPGLSQVSRCLAWARTRTDFPLDAVSIDSDGKLCLNRAGGSRFLLGSGQHLDRKLKSLEILLAKQSELHDAASLDYVNLVAYDAPAVRMRSVSHADSVTVRGVNPPQ
ncbi:MAG: FtsQ-type POTRA domain-containing protein [Cytophagales bacterium]|nr:FtsQ-type POTRA domain-containing protein [Armatimonadota bacterium]